MQDLDQLKEEIFGLTAQLRAQSQQSLEALDDLAKQNTENVKRLTALEREVSEVLGRQHAALEELKISLQQQTRNDDRKRISSERQDLRTEIVNIKEELQQLREGNDQAALTDSFYARTLGAILGQNIEALQPGNFEQMSRQVGERLNQLFQLEVPHGDVLRPLRLRAEAVNVALKDVATQMAKINPQAATEIRPRLQQAEALAAELSGLQAQLQNRRATIEATLHVPVSLHAGARQTFLDELGRGIRREIDKLSEPQSYFAAELKRLITNDIISVADVCDTSVAHPGSRPELETALSVLFAHSGLRTILPRQGEPFKSAEQEMVRTLPGESRKSKSIAQVVRRGFYYSQNDSEALLRKAGVVVYR